MRRTAAVAMGLTPNVGFPPPQPPPLGRLEGEFALRLEV